MTECRCPEPMPDDPTPPHCMRCGHVLPAAAAQPPADETGENVFKDFDFRAAWHRATRENERLEAEVERLSAAQPPAEQVAQRFHEAYERLAPSFGYETRRASAKPWADVPEPNRSLMVAVADEVLMWLQRRTAP